MYIIATGDPVSGFSFFGNDEGLGWEEVDEAVAEADRVFGNMD